MIKLFHAKVFELVAQVSVCFSGIISGVSPPASLLLI